MQENRVGYNLRSYGLRSRLSNQEFALISAIESMIMMVKMCISLGKTKRGRFNWDLSFIPK